MTMKEGDMQKTKYKPQPLIKGCWQFSAGHGQSVDIHEAIKELIIFADAGITTFDGADIYTGVEALLGSFRTEYEKQRGIDAVRQIKIHTKFVPDLDQLAHIDRAYIERIIDRSLMRLGVDQLDLVQFHWWDFSVPGYVEAALILKDLQSEGKIAHIGVTNFDVPRLRELVESGVSIATNQVQYSVIDQRPEHGMTEFAAKNEIGLLCYGTVAGGFISENYLSKPEPEGILENRSLTKYKLIIDDLGGWKQFQEVLEVLNVLAKKHSVSIATMASRIVLDKPTIASVILGAGARHIEDLLKIQNIHLDEEDVRMIRELSKETDSLKGDIYALEREKGGRHSSIMKYNLNTDTK